MRNREKRLANPICEFFLANALEYLLRNRATGGESQEIFRRERFLHLFIQELNPNGRVD